MTLTPGAPIKKYLEVDDQPALLAVIDEQLVVGNDAK